MTRSARPQAFAGVRGVRVGDEAADELVAQSGRKDTKEVRNRVLVAAEDERLCPAGLGSPFEQRGGVAVVVAGELDDALVDRRDPSTGDFYPAGPAPKPVST